MKIEEFRKKSALGGFDTSGMSDHEMLLNPESFQAVGKVEGWQGKHQPPTDVLILKATMHSFIDDLCDGKTIEEALEQATT